MKINTCLGCNGTYFQLERRSSSGQKNVWLEPELSAVIYLNFIPQSSKVYIYSTNYVQIHNVFFKVHNSKHKN